MDLNLNNLFANVKKNVYNKSGVEGKQEVKQEETKSILSDAEKNVNLFSSEIKPTSSDDLYGNMVSFSTKSSVEVEKADIMAKEAEEVKEVKTAALSNNISTMLSSLFKAANTNNLKVAEAVSKLDSTEAVVAKQEEASSTETNLFSNMNIVGSSDSLLNKVSENIANKSTDSKIVIDDPQPTPVDDQIIVIDDPQPKPVDDQIIVIDDPQPKPVDDQIIVIDDPQPKPVDDQIIVIDDPKPTPVTDDPIIVIDDPQPKPVDDQIIVIDDPQPIPDPLPMPPNPPLPPFTSTVETLEDGSTITTRTWENGNWEKVQRDVFGNLVSQEGGTKLYSGGSIGSVFKKVGGFDFDLPFDVKITNPNKNSVEISYTMNAMGEVTLNASDVEINALSQEVREITIYGDKMTTWDIPLSNLTIVGDNNTIKGSTKDDNIAVKGNNNKVDLAAGEDSLAIKGDNNTIKNVEDLSTATWFAPAGEKGSIEWVNKLLGGNFVIEGVTNPQYDEEGRLVSFVAADPRYPIMRAEVSTYNIDYDSYRTNITCTSEATHILEPKLHCDYEKQVISKSFDSNDKLIDESLIEYNADGNPVKENFKSYYSGICYESDTQNIWNGDKLINQKYVSLENGVVTSITKTSYEYDANGREIKYEQIVYDGNDNQIGRYIYTNEYYENGNLKKTNYSDEYADGSISKGYSEYYENGNVEKIVTTRYDADGVRAFDSVRNYDKDGAFVNEEISVTVKPGQSEYFENLSLSNDGKENVTAKYTKAADGKAVLDASGLTISADQIMVYRDFVNTVDADVNAVKADVNTVETDDKIIISPRYWNIAMKDLTINGNNNNIVGSYKDDKISVNGNNNVVDLKEGDDELNIIGNNNKIKNVETVTMNQTQPTIPVIKPGEVGSVEYVGKLMKQDLSDQLFHCTFDENGRVTEMVAYALDEWGNEMRGGGRSFIINYDDVAGETTISPYQEGMQGGGSYSYTFRNSDNKMVRSTFANPSLGPSGWKSETVYNDDGTSVETKIYNNPDKHDGVAKEVIKNTSYNRTITSLYDVNEKNIRNHVVQNDSTVFGGDKKFTTKEEAEKDAKESIEWFNQNTIYYKTSSTFILDIMAKENGVSVNDIKLFNGSAEAAEVNMILNDDGTYSYDFKLKFNYDYSIGDKSVIKPSKMGSMDFVSNVLGQNFDADKYDFEYDEQGRLSLITEKHEFVTYDKYGKELVAVKLGYIEYNISYNDEAQEMKVIPQKVGIDGAAMTELTYNVEGKLVRKLVYNPSLGDGKKTLYEYKADGSYTQTVTIPVMVANPDNPFDNVAKIITEYDANGKVISVTKFDMNGVNLTKKETEIKDFVGNLMQKDLSGQLYHCTFDENGRVTEMVAYAIDEIGEMRGGADSFVIKYNDVAGETTIHPYQEGMVGGGSYTYTFRNSDNKMVRSTFANPSLGPSGWKSETIYNDDGSSVETRINNDPECQGGIEKIITVYDKDGNVISYGNNIN